MPSKAWWIKHLRKKRLAKEHGAKVDQNEGELGPKLTFDSRTMQRCGGGRRVLKK